jgi:hypothetical protein
MAETGHRPLYGSAGGESNRSSKTNQIDRNTAVEQLSDAIQAKKRGPLRTVLVIAQAMLQI